MAAYTRIEAETETHRMAKAVGELVRGAELPLRSGAVAIDMNPAIVGEPAGQHLLALHVHLLARMKGVVQNIFLPLAVDPPLQPGVPLVGSTLGAGLRELVASLSGAESTYRTELVLGCSEQAADVRVGIGVPTGDVTVGADAWRAFLGEFVALSRWSDCCPLGPYFAATLAAAEVFKRLLRINLGWQEGALLEDAAYSLMDYSLNDHAASGPDLPEVTVRDLAVAGAGAGGTAALYTLASFPRVSGSVVAVEPGRLKESNLGRYLMSNYAQVHGHVHKLESVERFLEVHAPKLRCKVVDAKWHEVSRAWQTVLATVDTPEARWDVQRSRPAAVLDAGVMGLLFAVLRVVPGGWCLECKHPPDPEVTWRQRALRWGLTVGDVKQRYYNRVRVSMEDVERLADVQGRPVDDLKSLVGVPFDEVPALTECGQAALSLAVPSQAPVVPMSTTAAGIVLAAEIVKDSTGIGTPLHNYLVQDLRFRLRADGHKFKPRLPQCRSCSP